MRFDFELLCISHTHLRIPIRAKDCSFELLQYITKQNLRDVFTHCIENKNKILQPEILELFELSVKYDSDDIARYLYTHYTIPNHLLHEYILYGIKENYMDMVYYIISETDIDLNMNDYEILSEAVKNNQIELVKYLLDHPRLEDPSSGTNAPFIISIEMQNHKLFSIMLNHQKIDPHEPLNDPFKVALEIEDKWVLRKLLNNPFVSRTLQLDEYEKYRLHEIFE